MSPVLSALVTQANSIQTLSNDQTKRALAFVLSGFTNALYGQTPVVTQLTSLNPVTAQSIAAAFQGMSEEQYTDVLLLTIINTAIRLNSVTTATLSTNAQVLSTLINANWGGAPGITDAQQVDALVKYGTLIQAGANLTGLTNPF